MKKTLFILLSFIFFTAVKAQHHPRWKKESAQHEMAIRQCNEEYKAAIRSAELLRGRDRKFAIEKAKKDQRQCIANAH